MPTRRALLRFLAATPALAALRPAEAALPNGAAHLDFLDRLPEANGPSFVDDAKLLLGWTADAAAVAVKQPLHEGDAVDRTSGFKSVPGFAPPTDITGVAGRYRLLAPPFAAHYYYGLMFGLLGAADKVEAVLIASRLCRLPVVLHEPGGLGSDAWTDVGLMTGFRPASLGAALTFADQAKAEADRLGVPLIATGQSQAGGTAQLQVAHLVAADPKACTGFVTFNAACSRASIRHVGMDPSQVPGVNFAKDLDPLVGPHSNVSNEIGLQVYIHTDGTASLKPRGSYLQAALHPREHFLDSFNGLQLGK
ncbi:MAG TPA: hypothetical protein VH722_16780, partial [Alphaproteobacteria bacterium]|nr:hypothetical protein [Alphaproteobacteria bacterium]